DQLFPQYQGQWIGFSDGAVIASGTRPVVVLHEAHAAAEHPFVTCVGHENEPCRMRRSSFPYDKNYPGEALPVMPVEFRRVSGVPGMVLDYVIVDTGADASALPWADCLQLQLDPTKGMPGVMTGVAGGSAKTFSFLVWVEVD